MCLFPPTPRPSALAVMAIFWKTALTVLRSPLCLPMADRTSPDPPVFQPLPKLVSASDDAKIRRRKGYILFKRVPQVARSPPAHLHFCTPVPTLLWLPKGAEVSSDPVHLPCEMLQWLSVAKRRNASVLNTTSRVLHGLTRPSPPAHGC